MNPLSRFDFGLLSALPNAGDWQAKDLPSEGKQAGNGVR